MKARVALALFSLVGAWALDVEYNLPGPRLNVSPSIPVGFYWFTPGEFVRSYRVGDTVVACFTGELAARMRELSDLGAGSCPSGDAPAAKMLAATSPSVVTFAHDGVHIDGDRKPWPLSRPLTAHPLLGTITLAPRQVLLLGLNRYSADGRYLGGIDDHVIIGTWRPLLVSNEKDH